MINVLVCVYTCVFVYVCHMYVSACEVPERALNPLDLELQVVNSCLTLGAWN